MAANSPLDRIDRCLLGLLSNNARASNKELAAAVGLSPSACHGRVQRLIERGIVRGFHADVAPEALGVRIRAIVFVELTRHHKSLVDAFRETALSLPEVLDVFYVAGSHDLLLHVAVEDVEHLRRLVNDELSTHDAVGRIETSLIFEHHRRSQWPDYVGDDA
jgi:DNA-binding Lrp family transcriptional regulator